MKLAHYSNESGEKEYAIITEDDTNLEELEEDGCTLSGSSLIPDSLIPATFPLNYKLVRE